MALPTGFPPAWFRLEDGCLMCSATTAILKMVSAAGFAPAVTRSQAGHVAATPRAVRPGVLGAHRGLCFMGIAGPTHLEPESRGKIYKIGALDGTCTHTLPADNGLLFYSATRAKWWEVLVTLQSSLPACLKTPVLQTGSRITSRKSDWPAIHSYEPSTCVLLRARLWRTSFALVRLCVGSERRMVAGVGV